MGFEVWIVIVLLASGLSGWIGYAYAKKEAPKQSEIDAVAAELEEARGQAESVQANVSEHFEQSAMLFGKLAADYRQFLDHFESSAQSLGLSEARARELIEQGFQPLLTHQDEAVLPEAGEEAGPAVADEPIVAGPIADEARSDEAHSDEVMVDEASTKNSSADESSVAEPASETPETAAVGKVTVELPDESAAASEAAEAAEKKEALDSANKPQDSERQRA